MACQCHYSFHLTAALLHSEKSSHGSGARIRVTPFELTGIPGAISSHRFGAFGTQIAELVINCCERHSVPGTLCQKDISAQWRWRRSEKSFRP